MDNNYYISLLAQSTNKVTKIKSIVFNNNTNHYKPFNYYLRRAINKYSQPDENIKDTYCKSDLSLNELFIYNNTSYINRINSIYDRIGGI